MAQLSIKLIPDPDRNPLNLVLGTFDIVTAYVDHVRAAKPRWPSMSVVERMTFLAEFAVRVLDALEIPPPVKVGSTLHMGAFEPSTWRIFLVKPSFSGHDWKDIAEQAGHVFHEFEHLAATYVAARYLAAAKTGTDQVASTLDIPKDIAMAAAADPLPSGLMQLGKACHFRVTSEKRPAAPTDYYRRLHANIKKSQVEVTAAETRLAEQENAHSFSKDAYMRTYAEKRLKDKQLAAALREYELSETEIGSNVVENLVKSRLMQKAKATP